MDLLSKSTILFINQTRQENFEKLIGKGISEALSWHKNFEKIIFLCYSSTDKLIYKKKYNNCYLIGIPFNLSNSPFKSIFNISKNYINLYSYLNKLLKKTQINIIRLENLLLSGPPIYLVSKIKNIPYVIWLGGFERKSLAIKYQNNLITYFLSKLIILFEKIILKNSNFVFAVTNELFELAQKRNVKNKLLSPNFVDLTKFRYIIPKEGYKHKKKLEILYVGRFEEEKGIRPLLKAMKILSRERNDFECSLVGTGSLKEWIINYIRKYNLNNVNLLGIYDHNEMPIIYNRADIFILPSYTEGSPASLMEAMSCGLASIATTVGLCKTLINSGENGILIPPGNPKKIYEAINFLIDNHDLRKKFGQNGRNSILNYTKNYTKIHKYIYQKILNQTNN